MPSPSRLRFRHSGSDPAIDVSRIYLACDPQSSSKPSSAAKKCAACIVTATGSGRCTTVVISGTCTPFTSHRHRVRSSPLPRGPGAVEMCVCRQWRHFIPRGLSRRTIARFLYSDTLQKLPTPWGKVFFTDFIKHTC